ncbi:MAG: helix-turn-helix transcriptional regulator [Desulfovibrionaceae bacterium]|nr:helix-turn-helix transcriptional regulator [Desulfovibrionaceae bacterium]
MEFSQKLGRRIREIRHIMYKTQDAVAEEAGISSKYLGEIERGEVSVSAYIVFCIARALGVTIEEIFRFEHCTEADSLKSEVRDMLEGLSDSEMRLFYKVLRAVKY